MAGYFDSGVTKCSPCQSGCVKCTSATVCQTCNTSQGYVLKTGLCSCELSGFYVDSKDGSCLTCSSQMFGCGSCTNSSVCEGCLLPNDAYEYSDDQNCSCKADYYELNNKCVLCSEVIIGCLSCASANECLACDTDSNFSANENLTCSCPDTYYINIQTSSCSLCSAAITGCS